MAYMWFRVIDIGQEVPTQRTYGKACFITATLDPLLSYKMNTKFKLPSPTSRALTIDVASMWLPSAKLYHDVTVAQMYEIIVFSSKIKYDKGCKSFLYAGSNSLLLYVNLPLLLTPSWSAFICMTLSSFVDISLDVLTSWECTLNSQHCLLTSANLPLTSVIA